MRGNARKPQTKPKEANVLNSESSMEANAVMTRSATKGGKQIATTRSGAYDPLKKTHDALKNSKLSKDLQKQAKVEKKNNHLFNKDENPQEKEDVDPNQSIRFIDEDLPMDEGGDDPDYVYEEPTKADLPFNPTTTSMEKELDKLAQEDKPDPEEEMKNFLESEPTIKDADRTLVDNQTKEEVSKKPENLDDEVEDDGIYDPIIGKFNATEHQPLDQDDEMEDLEEDLSKQNIGLLRRKRTSKYDITDKQSYYNQLIRKNITSSIPLGDILGICPDFRKFLHDSTKGTLVAREGPVKSSQ